MTAGDFIDRLFEHLARSEPFYEDPFDNEELWYEALAAFGREAVPGLMRQAQKGKPFRTHAILVLGYMEGEAAEAVDFLIGLLKEENKSDRMNVPWDPPSAVAMAADSALGWIKPVAALPQLIRILTGGPQRARASAARICAEIGPQAHEALPALRRRAALRDQLEEDFRKAIAAIEGGPST